MPRLLLLLLLFILSDSNFAQGTPDDVVGDFLDAWNESDYARMYGYLAPQSQESYPLPVFESRYESVWQMTQMTGLNYKIHDIQFQGETVAVSYDLVMESTRFGTIDDPGRIMRLINVGDSWRIAWSSLDIFDALAGDSQIRVDSRSRARAAIYDRDGLPIATEGNTTVALYSTQNRMNGVNECRNLLGEVTRESIVYIEEQFNSRNPETYFFLGELPQEDYQLDQQVLFEICGVTPNVDSYTSLRTHRVYYGNNAMTHVTGYVGQIAAAELDSYLARGYSAGELIGKTGMEEVYQDVLAGQPDVVLRIIEPGGTVLREIAGATGTEPTPIQLTIDRELQLITAQAISDAFNYARPNWGDPNISPGGAAIVLDVNSGAILALTSYPLVNPNAFNPDSAVDDRVLAIQRIIADGRDPTRNRAISEQLSPGSTYKLVTAAAVLNEELVSPDDTFYCDLYWYGQDYGDTLERRPDWRASDPEINTAAGEISPAEAIMASCNPFFWQFGAELYDQIGPSAGIDYAQRMGLGQAYGLNMGFPEASGSLAAPASADAAISEAVGQLNIALPPLQLAVLTAAIANGGTVYEPYVIEQVGGFDDSALTFQRQPEVINTLDFNPGVLETIQEGMCGVTTVKDLGTAYIRFGDPTAEYHPPTNYSVCGKTGTAQTARFPNAWFVAYAPAQDPEIAVVVVVEQSLEGSQVAAPIVRRILDDYFGESRTDFPPWWNNETYVPLTVPEGGGAA